MTEDAAPSVEIENPKFLCYLVWNLQSAKACIKLLYHGSNYDVGFVPISKFEKKCLLKLTSTVL